MSDSKQERALEWEPAVEPLKLDGRNVPTPPFFRGTQSVVVARDAEFRLTIRAEGRAVEDGQMARVLADRHGTVPGTVARAEKLTFDSYGTSCELHAVMYSAPESISASAEDPIPRFIQGGHIDRLKRTWALKLLPGEDVPQPEPVGAVAWRTEWFINGPEKSPFCRGTKRRRTMRFVRERAFHRVDLAENAGGGDAYSDHLLVETGTVRFAVCLVQKGHAPDWVRAVAIEYPAPFPDDDTREAISEIVSFVFGRRLMRIGSTDFDASGWAIADEIVSPWGDGIARLCRRPDLEPIPLRDKSDDAEALLKSLVPRYLDARSTYGLKDAFLTYWLAREAPLAADLALYASAVEAVKKAWFKSLRTKSKGVHMPVEAFEKLVGDLLATITERLTKETAPKAIANRLRGAYQMGANEQIRAFFDELVLSIGPAEEAAMRARNLPAHGGLTANANVEELIRHTHAYRTLFDRTVLRLLDYAGPYIDRTMRGYPLRALQDPPGGAAAE